jgi:hypothetical protein
VIWNRAFEPQSRFAPSLSQNVLLNRCVSDLSAPSVHAITDSSESGSLPTQVAERRSIFTGGSSRD